MIRMRLKSEKIKNKELMRELEKIYIHKEYIIIINIPLYNKYSTKNVFYS